MAAIRKLSNLPKFGSNILSPSSVIPPLVIFYRGIASKLFVGGLSFYTSEQGLSEAFSQHGQVIEDRSKGFGFVTYASEDEAEKAITEMDGKELNGRVVFVDYAKPRSGGSRNSMPIARGPPESAPES
ncbi:Small RNA-binding protein 11, chloroplastic, variant 2 [Salvia divinorum]|uniref:Small RNA-binding protein 11, chloroplastic, variant 2 n=1 Tax=Salvia divinorum TaxID=28513 RepID=A0ABD1GPM6_SALDI